MPNYYNPYNFFPQTYPGITSMQNQNAYVQPVQQQPFTPGPVKPMEWVEGEVGAKAFQMPQSWPANQPIPLWDSTDTIIYLKSWSPMGMPNPLQKLKYEILESQATPMLTSGAASATEYVTKDDIKSLREEIQSLKDSMNNRRNQNGSNQAGQNNNKGGN